MINWKVRIKQQWFWITLASLLFLLIDQIRDLGQAIVLLDASAVLYNGPVMLLVIKIIGVAFAILALIGFPVDLTTEGYGDGVIGLSRTEPAPNASTYGLVEYKEEVEAAETKSFNQGETNSDLLTINYFEATADTPDQEVKENDN